ncbi:hypothetical protein EG68_04764 [Paragonimus skrjabini miyazakii]|uniref:Uncharacterized protein n=1 Tax=Paragonimus skrjabini miyazakii TaxID=59628 RepID=A0A8S9YY94_9TREM|nr:hypothetical protein EG68_04764 [Paragonimus skrjabini miyazakii]
MKIYFEKVTTTQAECIQAELVIYRPKYLTSINLTLPGNGPVGKTLVKIAEGPQFTKYKALGFFFNDYATLSATNVTYIRPVVLPQNVYIDYATIVTEFRCTRYNQTVGSVVGSTIFERDFSYNTFVAVSVKGEQIGDLGMKDVSAIKDCQITVSGVANPTTLPKDIRRNLGSGWLPAIRSEPFQKYTGITVTFGRLTTVYYLMATVIGTDKLRILDLYATFDGYVYYFIEQVPLAYLQTFASSMLLERPLTTRGIRLVDKTYQNGSTLSPITIEIYGMMNMTDTNTFDPCALTTLPMTVPLPASIVVQPRVFLYANDSFIFCDYQLHASSKSVMNKRCLLTSTISKPVWRDLGPSVSQVLSYSPSKNLLFGLGPERNQQSLLLSADLGKRWVSVNQFAYTALLDHVVDLVNATAIPWTVIAGQFDSNTKGVQCVAYTAGPFQICYDGIYYNGTLAVDWNSACSVLPDL